jgi:hypothetical protein
VAVAAEAAATTAVEVAASAVDMDPAAVPVVETPERSAGDAP